MSRIPWLGFTQIVGICLVTSFLYSFSNFKPSKPFFAHPSVHEKWTHIAKYKVESKEVDENSKKKSLTFIFEKKPICLFPWNTAPWQGGMQLPSHLRLTKIRNSECRLDKFIILLEDFIFSLFLSAAALPCCYTEPLAAMGAHLGRQHETRYCTFRRIRHMTVCCVCIWPSPFQKRMKFSYFCRQLHKHLVC